MNAVVKFRTLCNSDGLYIFVFDAFCNLTFCSLLRSLEESCFHMAVFASPYGEALLTHLPSRGVYSPEVNTIRKLFPKSKRHPSFSVLIYAEDLADVFNDLHRVVGDAPRQCTEDTDLIDFLKCNLFASGEGYFHEALSLALEDPMCIGVLLGIGCVASMELPIGCRFTNPRWGPKVAAHAKRIAAPKPIPGSLTLQEIEQQRNAVAIDVDALATSGLERRKWRTLSSLKYHIEAIDVEDDDDDVVAVVGPPPQATVSPPVDSLEVAEENIMPAAPSTDIAMQPETHLAASVAEASEESLVVQDNEATTPVESRTSPVLSTPPAGMPPPPQPRLIELLHVDGCASLLKMRRYVDPIRRRLLSHKEQTAQVKAAAKKKAAKKERAERPKPEAAPRPAAEKRKRNYTVILDEPSVRTRRQRKETNDDAVELASVESIPIAKASQRQRQRAAAAELEDTVQALATLRTGFASKCGASKSSNPLSFSQQQSAARDPNSGRFRPLTDAMRAKQDADTQRRREERRELEQERSSASNPRLFHMVDVAPGKRSRTLWVPPADAVRRRRRRKPKVVVID